MFIEISIGKNGFLTVEKYVHSFVDLICLLSLEIIQSNGHNKSRSTDNRQVFNILFVFESIDVLVDIERIQID
jgi:hypothetical protein